MGVSGVGVRGVGGRTAWGSPIYATEYLLIKNPLILTIIQSSVVVYLLDPSRYDPQPPLNIRLLICDILV